MPPRVVVVLLCYNGLALTLQCLASLRQLTYPNVEVVVVDNASRDDTVTAVPAAYPEVHLVAAGDNLGYAAGNNLGIRTALERGADLVWLLNNDTLVEPDCLTELVAALQADATLGVVGPMVYTWEAGRRISSAGGYVDWRHADALNVGVGEDDHGQYPAREVDFINGCCLLVTRAALERGGWLAPEYFMYWEETDWCLRLRRAGFKIGFVPAARIRHKAPIEHVDLSPLTQYYVTRNRLVFFARHTPWPLKGLTLWRAVRGIVHGSLRHWRLGRRAYINVGPVALLHALQRRLGRLEPAQARAHGW